MSAAASDQHALTPAGRQPEEFIRVGKAVKIEAVKVREDTQKHE